VFSTAACIFALKMTGSVIKFFMPSIETKHFSFSWQYKLASTKPKNYHEIRHYMKTTINQLFTIAVVIC
jgi:hypothetical protein